LDKSGTAPVFAAELACGFLTVLDCDSPTLRTRPAIVRLRNRTLSPAARRFLELARELESELLAAERPIEDVASTID